MLPIALGSIIEGKGLYKYSVGELFELYGQFQGKYQLKYDKQTKAKLSAFLNEDSKYLKPIKARNNRNKVELQSFAICRQKHSRPSRNKHKQA